MAKAEKPAKTGRTTDKAKTEAEKVTAAAKPKPAPKKGKASTEEAKAKVGVVKGKVEKAAGKATGNKKLQARGAADEQGAKGYGKAAKAGRKLGK